MALIDKETIRKEIQRLEQNILSKIHHYPIHRIELLNDLLAFLDTIPEQPVNLPKWQKLRNIDSYSNRKIWRDDKVLYVADNEGYLYGCSIRELFDKLPKEE